MKGSTTAFRAKIKKEPKPKNAFRLVRVNNLLQAEKKLKDAQDSLQKAQVQDSNIDMGNAIRKVQEAEQKHLEAQAKYLAFTQNISEQKALEIIKARTPIGKRR